MAIILETMPLGSPRTQRQNRIQPVQSLNGRLLIHAEHRSMLRRLKVEADDVGGFLLELRIVGGHVAVQLMRLQTQLRPHPLHCGFTDTQCCCHLAAGPMRGPIDWLALRFPCDAGLQSSIGDAWFTALMKRIEAIDAGLLETLLPTRNRRCCRLQRRHNFPVTSSLRER